MRNEDLEFLKWQIEKLKEYEAIVNSDDYTEEEKKEAYQHLIIIGVLDEDGNLARRKRDLSKEK